MTNIPWKNFITENFENANSKGWLRKTKSSQKTILCTLYLLSTLGVEWLF